MKELNLFLSLGQNITQQHDPLQKINISQLVAWLSDNEELKQMSVSLKQLYLLDKSSYNQMKRKLPYVVPGIFSPPYRLKANFGYTQFLILDIDHISQTGRTVLEIKNQIKKDPRVILAFTSPSGDGIKVFFVLGERCSSPELYSGFYKYFSHQFASQYNLLASVDKVTSDVTRACFLCHDADVYWNKGEVEPLNIDINQLLSLEEGALSKEKGEGEKVQQVDRKKNELPKEIFDEIRRTLNPEAMKKQSRTEEKVYITRQLKDLEPRIHDRFRSLQQKIQSYNIRHISYALQISVTIGGAMGEVNLFHGKRGFSIVVSTRSNTNADVSELLKDILQDVINEFVKEERKE